MERARGLLGRVPPAPGHAMWIVPCHAVHTWGMQYPIDVAFLDERGLVLQVAPNCVPCRAFVDRRAHSVLELRAGECARLHLRAGERLALPSALRPAATPLGESSAPTLVSVAAVVLVVLSAWLLSGCASVEPGRVSQGSAEPAQAVEELRLQAGLEYDSREWARAEAAYRQLVHRSPDDPAAWLRLGTALLHLGRPDEAADVFMTMASRGDGSRELSQALAIARVAQAAAALRRAAAVTGESGSDSRRVVPGGADADREDARQLWTAAAERLERLLPPTVPPGRPFYDAAAPTSAAPARAGSENSR